MVRQRPGELKGADHQAEDGESVYSSGLGVARVEAHWWPESAPPAASS